MNNIDRKTYENIGKVIKRAVKMKLMRNRSDEKVFAFMDMEIACKHFGKKLDLDAMLSFDDFSFAHDFYGIGNHINHESGEFNDLFIPRCCHD